MVKIRNIKNYNLVQLLYCIFMLWNTIL